MNPSKILITEGQEWVHKSEYETIAQKYANQSEWGNAAERQIRDLMQQVREQKGKIESMESMLKRNAVNTEENDAVWERVIEGERALCETWRKESAKMAAERDEARGLLSALHQQMEKEKCAIPAKPAVNPMIAIYEINRDSYDEEMREWDAQMDLAVFKMLRAHKAVCDRIIAKLKAQQPCEAKYIETRTESDAIHAGNPAPKWEAVKRGSGYRVMFGNTTISTANFWEGKSKAEEQAAFLNGETA